MNYFQQREEKVVSEAQEDSYRKKFPKGKDWKTPKKNPYGFCGLDEDSYHGMKTVAVSIEKYNELKEKYEELEQKYYFDMRNKQIEIEVLKTQINKG